MTDIAGYESRNQVNSSFRTTVPYLDVSSDASRILYRLASNLFLERLEQTSEGLERKKQRQYEVAKSQILNCFVDDISRQVMRLHPLLLDLHPPFST